MKRTVILLLIFALFGGATWYYLNNKQDKVSSVSWDRNFAIDDVDQIHKIFIAPRTNVVPPSTFVRNGDHWIMNDQYKANQNAIKNVLDFAKRVRVSYLAAKAATPTMVKDLSTNGIKVEFYDKAGKALKKFYVGGMTNDELGTYMIMEDANQPYVTHIPSWEGGLRARFTLRSEQWRDRSVFDEKVENIKAVSIEYPLQKNKSFKLERKGTRDFEVRPFYEINAPNNKKAKPGVVENFLMGFESIAAEGFINEHNQRDSISQMLPFAIVKLTNTEDKTKEVRFHPLKIDMRATDPGTNPAIERYHADVVDGDYMLVQHRLFEKIFWPYERFF